MAYMPRERAMAEGVFALGDAELLALLLGTGARGRTVMGSSNQLLRECPRARRDSAKAGPFALADRSGMGIAKALRLLGGVELGRRFVYRAGRRCEPLASSQAVFARFGPVIGQEDEEMWVMAVDARNLVRGCRKVALGGVHACGMHPRNILRTALLEGAVGMVVVHNHPSGARCPRWMTS